MGIPAGSLMVEYSPSVREAAVIALYALGPPTQDPR